MSIRLRLMGSLSARRLEILVFGSAGLISLAAARLIAHSDSGLPKPLVALLGLAAVATMVSISSEHLLLGWLFLAPLFQESARLTSIGHAAAVPLYVVPPIVLAAKALVGRTGRPRRWFDLLPAAYVAYVFASLAITTNLLAVSLGSSLRIFFQTIALGALVYYVIVFAPRRPFSAERVFGALLAACIVQSILAVIDLRTGWNLWGDTGWQGSGQIARAVWTLTNPARLGAFIGAGIVVGVSILCWNGPRSLRRLAVAAVVLGVPGLAVTYTRGPIVATLVVAAICVVLSSRSRFVSLLVIALAVIGLFALWPRITASHTYQSRLADPTNVQARLVLQRVSLHLAAEKPITGWGYQSFDRVKSSVDVGSSGSVSLDQALQSTSHDTFLTVLVDLGGIGLGLLLLPVVVIVWRALGRARAHPAERWLLVGGVSGIAVVMFSATTVDFRFFSFVPMLPWLFVGLLRSRLTPGTMTA